MPRFRTVAFSFALLSILIASTFCFAAAPDRITGPIAGQSVRLASRAPVQARPEFDQGAVDPSFKMSYITLLTVPSPAQQKALNKLLADQQNPHSASYHKWLTPEQYGSRFGLSPNDVNKITAWLQSQGFAIVRTARGRNFVVFSGTAAQVEKTFQTEIHNFNVNGKTYFANTTPPAIPAALSGVVIAFHGLNNFRPQSQAIKATDPSYTFAFKGKNYYFLAPGDIAAIYDVNTLYQNGTDGTGMTMAVMGQTGIYQSDLTNFRQNFGLSPISCTVSSDVITSCNTSNFVYTLVNGTPTDIYTGDLPEADLDIEWSGATARNAKIIFVDSTDPNGSGVWDSWYYAVDNNVAPVITMSYTSPCELAEAGSATGEGTIISDEAELAKANSLGITFLNSSGDTGAAECDNFNITQSNTAIYGYAVAYPASSQYVTGVGGTSIPAISPNEYSSSFWNPTSGADGGSAVGYIPEQPWNDPQEFGLLCTPSSSCTLNGQTVTSWPTAQQAIGISVGGGGVSNCFTIDVNGVCTGGFPQPSWQSGIVATAINPSGFGVTTTPARYSPDVSLLASPNFPGYLICTQQSALGGTGTGSTCDSPSTGIADMLNGCFAGTGVCSIFGGTSVSTPVFAGMVALLNQYLIANKIETTAGLGNINPTLYSLATANATNHAFNPVTTASTGSYSNGAWCSPGTPTSGVSGDPWPPALQCPSTGPNAGFLGFNAYNFDTKTGTNYNLVTGLGSVDVNNLFLAWAGKPLSPDFTIAVNAGQNSTTINTNVVWNGTLTAIGSYSNAVTLTCGTGAPSTCTIAPNPVTPTASPGAKFTVTVGSPTPGTFSFIVQGTDGTITHSQLVTLTVERDFTVSAVAPPPNANPGQTTTSSMVIATVDGNPFSDSVGFACTAGIPTGASCTITPVSGPIVNGTASPQTVNITLNTAGPFTGAANAMRGGRRAQNQHPRLWLPFSLPLAGIMLVGLVGRRIPRRVQVVGLCLALALAGFLVACGGGSSSPPIAVSVSPSSVNTLWPSLTGASAQTQQFTATVTGTSNTAVTWTISSGGTTDTISSTGLYTAPTAAPAGAVIVTATSAADTTKTGSATVQIKTPTPSGPYSITVTATEGTSLQHTTTFSGTIN